MIAIRSDIFYVYPLFNLGLCRNRLLSDFVVVQPGVRESIALTYELEKLWKLSAAAASNTSAEVGLFSDNALKRYVGTREGVYRVYPAIRVTTEFDPRERPWSVII